MSNKQSGTSTRSTFLEPGVRRDAMLASHPFSKDEQRLVTASVEFVFEHVDECLNYGRPGIAIGAESRHGKSACLYIITSRLLPQAHPNVFVARIEARPIESPVRRMAELMHDWLEDFRYPVKERQGKSAYRGAVLAYFRTRGSKDILLIIDEAQNYEPEDWAIIKGITNSLAADEADKIRMVIVSLFQGTPERAYQEARTKRRDVLTRFFLRRIQLRGICLQDDLTLLLKIFDDCEKEDHPEGSGICYTEAYFPMAFGGGWRLASEAERMWAAMVPVWPKATPVDIGLAAVMSVLRRFFVKNSGDDAPAFHGTEKLWAEAVSESDFLEYALNSVYTS